MLLLRSGARRAPWSIAPITVLLVLLTPPGGAQPSPASLSHSRPLEVEDVMAVRGFADRVPIALSPDGRLVAYTVSDPRRLAAVAVEHARYFGPTGTTAQQRGSAVLLTDVRTGATRSLMGDRGTSWGPVWSPDGRQLAFYADQDGRARVWAWDRAHDALRQVADAVVRPSFGFEQIRWSPDGRRLLVKLLPGDLTLDAAARLLPAPADAPPNTNAPDRDTVTARVYAALGDSAAPLRARTVVVDSARSFMNAALADLALVDVATGRVTRVARHVRPMMYRFSPDGRSVLLSSRHPYDARGQLVWGLYATTVLDTAGRTRLALPPATQEYGLGASWSPDGRYVAYTDGGALRVVAVDGGSEVARFARPGAGGTGASGTGASLAHDYRAPLWLAPDTLVAVAADTVWRLPLGGGAPRPVAAPPGRQLLDVVGRADAERVGHADAASGALLVLTRERATKRLELQRIDLRSGVARRLFALDAALDGDLPYAVDRSRDGGTVAFLAETADRPGEVWVADGDLARPRRLTELNPAVTRLPLGRSQLVRWTTARGDTLHGALLLPPDHQPGRRYPLVVKVYGGSMLSTTVDRFGLQAGVDNLQLLATRGYAVFLPDTPLRVGTPLADLATDVLPGVDAVIAMGVADPARLAVMGHSYGGYSTLALLVQTGRFRAAVASGSIGDLVGDYAHMRDDGSALSVGWLEREQGRMGASPWEARDRYLANSPFFALDRVQTPVLLVHGAADPTVPVAQAEQTFVGLRRLGKPVVLVEYAGEGHHPGEWRLANVRDYWARVFAWYARWLAPVRAAAR